MTTLALPFALTVSPPLVAAAADPEAGRRIAVMLALLALVVVGWWGMWRGWRHRLARQHELPAPLPPPAPEQRGQVVAGPTEGLYVSTTVAGRWMERIAAHGLGVRSAATLTVTDAGVVIDRVGAPGLLVPADALTGVSLRRGIAGKTPGRTSIVVLTWALGGPDGLLVDTGFQPRHAADRARLLDTIGALCAGAGAGAGTDAGIGDGIGAGADAGAGAV